MTINEEAVREVNRALEEVKESTPDLDPATTCKELRTVTTPAGIYFGAAITPTRSAPPCGARSERR